MIDLTAKRALADQIEEGVCEADSVFVAGEIRELCRECERLNRRAKTADPELVQRGLALVAGLGLSPERAAAALAGQGARISARTLRRALAK